MADKYRGNLEELFGEENALMTQQECARKLNINSTTLRGIEGRIIHKLRIRFNHPARKARRLELLR